MDDIQIARNQYIKAKRQETRLKFALMADAEVARMLPEWRREFDVKAREQLPQVLDLHSELRALQGRLSEGDK